MWQGITECFGNILAILLVGSNQTNQPAKKLATQKQLSHWQFFSLETTGDFPVKYSSFFWNVVTRSKM